MPKNASKRKGKGTANPIAVPSLENRPRYQTPAPETPSDAQQLQTPKATPAKARVVEEEPEEESEPTVEELQRWLATQVRLKKFEEKEREKVEERMEELMRTVWLAVEEYVEEQEVHEEDYFPAVEQLIEWVGYLEPEFERLKKKVNFNIAKVKEERKKRQELELCLATQKASIGDEDTLRAKLELAKEQVRKLEREVTDLQSRPKGRYVESLKGEVTFEEGAKYWKKR